MNAETLNDRLRAAKASRFVTSCVWELVRTGKTHPNYTTGRGRHIKLARNMAPLERTLQRVGIAYAKGNDAPRGGEHEDYVVLDRNGRRATEKIRATWKAEASAAKAADAEKVEQAEKAAKLGLLDKYLSDRTLPAIDVLKAWHDHGALHPAPVPVVEAKLSTGLSWAEVEYLCRTSFLPSDPGA